MRNPTDLEILELIYQEYYQQFSNVDMSGPDRATKILLPIDIREIAREFNVDGDIIFGRLYYHLEQKYGYKRDSGDVVKFFALEAGGKKHCINFPYMASVLANLQDEHRKFRSSLVISIIALVISAFSLGISLW